MKKAIKKVQDTGAVKVIPPYSRWVKICFALVWGLLIVGSLAVLVDFETVINCPEGKFPNNLESCVSCSDEQPRSVDSAEACNSCKDADGNPTRKIYKNVIGDPMFDNRCGLINCPEGKFLNILGNCVPCATSQPEPVESAEACAVCQDENGNPTRRMYKGTFNHPDVSDGCGLIECPKGMFLGKFGHCISCSDTREYDSTAEECAKCSDSRTYNSETQKCELKV